MKRPKWTESVLIKPHYTLGECEAADDALRQAAKALRIDAKLWRKEWQKEAAVALERTAKRLGNVADGETWADGFDWPVVDGKVK